jgi:hypothetical protein
VLTVVAVEVAVVVAVGFWTAVVAPPSVGTGAPPSVVVRTADATHFQVEGQSESTLHVETFG